MPTFPDVKDKLIVEPLGINIPFAELPIVKELLMGVAFEFILKSNKVLPLQYTVPLSVVFEPDVVYIEPYIPQSSVAVYEPPLDDILPNRLLVSMATTGL